MSHALTAKWWGWNRLEDFRQLPTDEQAEMIAVYQIENQIQAVLDHEQAVAQRRALRKK